LTLNGISDEPVTIAATLKRPTTPGAANRAVGRLTLTARRAGVATRPARLHERGPLRVRFPGAPARTLEAVLINTAGGLAGGDDLALEFRLEEGAAVCVTTAAAEKIYRSGGADATMSVAIEVGAGCDLAWLPQETILFDRARFRRTISADLADGARLLVAESVVFGRTGMGERVSRGFFFDRWRIRYAGRLAYAESTRLDGDIAETLALRSVADAGLAVATVLAVPGDDSTVAAVRQLEGALRGEVGASAWNGLAAVRLCAKSGADLRHDLVAILTALRGTRPPRLWFT
jgi:urease accessory protein